MPLRFNKMSMQTFALDLNDLIVIIGRSFSVTSDTNTQNKNEGVKMETVKTT